MTSPQQGHLRDSGFRTYIVSGCGIDFMRSITRHRQLSQNFRCPSASFCSRPRPVPGTQRPRCGALPRFKQPARLMRSTSPFPPERRRVSYKAGSMRPLPGCLTRPLRLGPACRLQTRGRGQDPMSLYLVELHSLHRWVGKRDLAACQDEGVALHHLLGEVFGPAVLQPFRLMVALRAKREELLPNVP